MLRSNLLISIGALTNLAAAAQPKEYWIYFIRHADSIWNEYKDDTALHKGEVKGGSAEIAVERGHVTKTDLVAAEVCTKMNEPYPNHTKEMSLDMIERTVKDRKGSVWEKLGTAAKQTLASNYKDAQLSSRGMFQTECLLAWIGATCPEDTDPGSITDANRDACRLQGIADRDRVIFVVSNLRRTRQTAMMGLGVCQHSPGTTLYALNFLQERGCGGDAIPDLTNTDDMRNANCAVMFPLPREDICGVDIALQNNVYDQFVNYVETANRVLSDRIFVVTGHSSWLMDFYRKKLPAKEESGKRANDLEIRLTRGKLGNASVIKFKLAIGQGGSWIVPDSTEMVYGYYKGGKGA